MQLAIWDLIGLAVMGQNLVLNMNDPRLQRWRSSIALSPRSMISFTDEAAGTQVVGAHSIPKGSSFSSSKPPAARDADGQGHGDAVDQMIEDILPHLIPG